MDIETRLTNLENLVAGLIKNMNQHNSYVDSDITGCRKDISEVTPYKDSKTAYIGDNDVIFSGVPDGDISVYVKASDGTYPSYRVERVEDVVIVSFDELETTATITISII